MTGSTAKRETANLLNTWFERSGLQKQAVAIQAGFLDYNGFYHAYLNLSRNIAADPTSAVALLQVFTHGLPAHKRCSASEAARFFRLTQQPIESYERVWQLRLFPADEWRAAISEAITLPATPAEEDSIGAQLHSFLSELRRSLERPSPPDPLAAANNLLAQLPTEGDGLPAPAPLPLPHRMPFHRNGIFCGRESELRQLGQLLKDTGIASGRIVAISGLGGAGKTNLATEFVHRYGQFFAGGVFWLTCANVGSVAVEVAACGASGLVERSDWSTLSLHEQTRLVMQAWQAPLPRLLVLDNCEDVEILRDWLPTSGGCRVLLTTRRFAWPQPIGVVSLALRELPRPDSLALLRCYRPDLPDPAPDLDLLAAQLGDLPLALHLAGSYLRTYRHDPPFGDPAHLLGELRATDLLGHEAMQGIDVEQTATNHALHVEQTFAVSLNRLDQEDLADALARQLLGRAALFAPNEPFPRTLLLATVALEGVAQRGERQRSRALRRLLELGLLSEEGELLFIHPLVAAYARRIDGSVAARTSVEQALECHAEERFRADDVQGMHLLLPHLRQRTDAAWKRNDELAARLCNTLPFLMEVAGDIGGGIPYLERARQMLESSGALETALGAEVLNNLGEWYRAVGTPEQARSFHEQSLAIRRQILPPDDPDIAQSCSNFAELLREQEDFAAAHSYYQEAITIWQRRLGPEHPHTLAGQNNMALLLAAQGRYSESAEQFVLVLAAAQKQLGPEDTRTARTHRNLGDVLRLQRDFVAARQHLDQARAVVEGKFGREHPETVQVLYHLALLDADEGAREQAITSLRVLFMLAQTHLGDTHPLTKRIQAALIELETWLYELGETKSDTE